MIVITVTIPPAERMIRTMQIQRKILLPPLSVFLELLGDGLGEFVRLPLGLVDGLVDGAGLKVGLADADAFGEAEALGVGVLLLLLLLLLLFGVGVAVGFGVTTAVGSGVGVALLPL